MFKSFVIAALAIAPALATPAVNIYWGQTGTTRLKDVCKLGGFEYITIGFVTDTPEHDPSSLGYPGTNFGPQCGDEYSTDSNGVKSHLLSHCPLIAADIPYCQSLGKKVLLSIGGFPNGNMNYSISSADNGKAFANFMYKAFGPVDSTWTGPRPFTSDNQTAVVDGFDFDIEVKFDDPSGYVATVAELRRLYAADGLTPFLSAAPECPLQSQFSRMKGIISQSEFDAFFIQFYNNQQCQGGPGSGGLNFDAWVTYLQTTPSANAKIFIGLPSSEDAAGSGYLPADDAVALLKKYSDRPAFGGAMFWDQNHGALNPQNGSAYYQYIHDQLIRFNTTVAPQPVCKKAYEVQAGDTCNALAQANNITVLEIIAWNSALNSTCNLLIGQQLCVKQGSPSNQTTGGPFTATTSASDYCEDETTMSETMSATATATATTSTVYTITTYTITSCAPIITDCPVGHVTTETVSVSTTVCPVSSNTDDVLPTYITSRNSSSSTWSIVTTTTKKCSRAAVAPSPTAPPQTAPPQTVPPKTTPQTSIQSAVTAGAAGRNAVALGVPAVAAALLFAL